MGIIPVLNNKQIDRFRALLASHQKIDLTTSSGKSPRRLPSYDDDDPAPPSPSSPANGFFTVADATTSTGDPPVYTVAVRIYDDANPSSGVAGAVHDGTRTTNIPSRTLTLSGTGTQYIYLQITAQSTSSSTTYSYQFVALMEEQQNTTDYVFFLPIAQVEVSASSVSVAVQYYRANVAFELPSVAWV